MLLGAASFIILLLSMFVVLVSLLKSDSAPQKLLSANAIGTIVMLLIVLFAYITDCVGLLDISLIYACLGFVSTVACLKFFPRVKECQE